LVNRALDAPKRGDVLAKYVATVYDSEVNAKDVPILTDDYAPAQSLLNPVTGAPYEGGESILPRSTLSPLVIGGVWIAMLVALYLFSSRIGAWFRSSGGEGEARRE